jgi:hypothetical protein
MGQVIGQSDAQASRPSTEPYEPKHLLGTIIHTLFDVGQLRLEPGVPRELLQFIEEARAIPELVS